ncbi:ShlB/FhaC/HecB family hemolysin secretion/activation protein [Glaciimonas sp. PCH181]|uniref:ShlB/FhaC/HecB family hemolysin secretion/activation protein n=1 Tax=Glaciimonas sp. PCH181 TaxID=2133943 RepID=UPI001CED64F5|nr:ShlB/FhaC/HecB family hemolysin secretion/activation protein [Glaciimonas sp. PCH181]
MKKYLVSVPTYLFVRPFFQHVWTFLLSTSATFIISIACIQTAQAAPTIQTSATEEQRRRSQAEALARQQSLQAPNVDLRTSTPLSTTEAQFDGINALSLPTDASCFTLQRVVLAVPPQLSPVLQLAGASALLFDPFRFARDYLQQYAGACVGKDGLNLIVQRLSGLILRHGYSTSRVGIPTQDLSRGTLTLALIPGVIRALRFTDPVPYGTWKNAFPTSAGRLLNLRDLEQGLEQMKRIPSQDVDLQIVPGTVPGESDILIAVNRGKPWKLSANLDDSGAQGTGKLLTGFNFSLDNPLGLSDMFNIGINTDADRKAGQHGTSGNNFYYAMPVGYWRFSVSASSLDYHQKIAGIDEEMVSRGDARNLEFTVDQLFQRNQSQKNSWQFKVGKRWSHSYIGETELDGQKRNTTFAELAWVHKHYFGNANLDITFANRWGVSWFNGQGDVDYGNSSDGIFRYTLQSIDATLVAPFSVARQPLTYIGTLRAQHSRSPLYLSERLTIGNRYTVRGFDGELTLAGERGFFFRNELDIPLSQSGQSAYVGIDIGKVYGPSVQDLLGDKLAGAAVGLRGGYGGFRYDLFSSWSLYKPEGFRTATPLVGFNLTYQY